MFYTLMMIAAYTHAIRTSTERCRLFETHSAPKLVMMLELENHSRLTKDRESLIADLLKMAEYATQSDIELAA